MQLYLGTISRPQAKNIQKTLAVFRPLEQLAPELHEVDVEVDAQQVPDQHAHPQAHKSDGAKFRVVDQDGAGKAVEGEPCPEDVGEELDEAGDLLVGADDGEEGGDCSKSIDADQHEQGEMDLPVSHLIQKRWF